MVPPSAKREFSLEYRFSVGPATEDFVSAYTVPGGQRVRITTLRFKAPFTTDGKLTASLHHGQFHVSPSESEAYVDTHPREYKVDELFKEHESLILHYKNAHTTDTLAGYVILKGYWE